MSTFLFDKIIFGPVFSRRLGISLGINLLPINAKLCNFNCIYCECGWTTQNKPQTATIPSRKEVKNELEKYLTKKDNSHIDVVTFAGNGEPTIHPDFAGIIDDTIELINCYTTDTKIAVLSNATLIHKDEIFNALYKVDYNILKIDSGFEETIKLIDNPLIDYNLKRLIENMAKFNRQHIIQTMFIKGTYQNKIIDNTTDKEIKAWLNIIKQTLPKQVMIYTIARDTPISGLEKVSVEVLDEIAEQVKALGIDVQISA